jgi:hypothetical protein
MTTADRTATISGDGGSGSESGPPLLHLRGTEYGFRVHGFWMGVDGRPGGGVAGRQADEDLGGCDHG